MVYGKTITYIPDCKFLRTEAAASKQEETMGKFELTASGARIRLPVDHAFRIGRYLGW